VLGALEYFEWLASKFGDGYGNEWKEKGFSGRRLVYKQAMSAIREYELELSRALIHVIESVPGTRIYGVTDMDRLDERVPTVSFRLDGKDPAQLAEAIGKQGVYVWNGHNYALAIVERMGLLEAGGMVRIGPVHYNTLDEIQRFGEVLKQATK
jgi:selenocysteine lyase/cysteine desulfurase